MADHRLRTKSAGAGAGVGAGAARPVTAGLIFGVQDSQRIEVATCVELAIDTAPDGSAVVDDDFLYTQKSLSASHGHRMVL